MTPLHPASWIASLPEDERERFINAGLRGEELADFLTERAPLFLYEQALFNPTDASTWADYYTALSTHARAMGAAFTVLAEVWQTQAAIANHTNQP